MSIDGYLALLTRWNAKIRLTGSTDRTALEQHVAEARSLLPHVPSHGRLVDIGAGGGFPGIVLATLRPDLRLSLVEPLAKKVAFLNACRRELGLSNVEVIRARDEDLLSMPDFVPFDVAVSQATFAPAEWFERGTRLVSPTGIVIGMLGPATTELSPAVELYPVEIAGHDLRIGVLRRSGDGA